MSKKTKGKDKGKATKWAKKLWQPRQMPAFPLAKDWRDYPDDTALITLMHTYRRPHDSKHERAFTKTFVDTVPGMEKDGFGNRHLIVGNEKPRIMFSSHVDTVHWESGRQKVRLDSKGILQLAPNTPRDCLGADDGAGVWIMLEMIKAEIPGLYTFHRGEERGGLGSTYIATHEPERIDGIDACIAFDRMDYDSVITHQGGTTASDSFASALAKELGGDFKPDDTGLFTDSANYEHLIPECSNLSVGYSWQHGPNESLNVGFLLWLRDQALSVDWNNLPADRVPGDDGYGGFGHDWRLDEAAYVRRFSGVSDGSYYGDQLDDAIGQPPRAALADLIRLHPDAAAKLLYDLGGNTADLREAIYEVEGELIDP